MILYNGSNVEVLLFPTEHSILVLDFIQHRIKNRPKNGRRHKHLDVEKEPLLFHAMNLMRIKLKICQF